jgi:hypothetical protein
LLKEFDRDALSEMHLIGQATGDIRSEPDARILLDGHDGNGVRRIEGGTPGLVVDRAADDHSPTGDRDDFRLGRTAVWTDGGYGKSKVLTGSALLEAEFTELSSLPEERVLDRNKWKWPGNSTGLPRVFVGFQI